MEPYYNLATLLCDKGDIEEGMRVFEQALHLKPESVEVHYARAQVWLRQADFTRLDRG